MVKEGEEAPDFSLPDQNGALHSLSSERGRFVLLYFYPKDDTSGCTKEACGIRDAWDEYKKRGITVFGVSKDSVESHKKFEEKYNLPFTLLADPEGKVVKAYGAAGGLFTKRISFLIDSKGVIQKTYPKVDPAVHAPQILKDFDSITG
ncbi:MAG: peroxiredoxin [Patescibacteria group bacterium]|nr:peroxiredoxin [Patescibacteria group bacterium]